MYEQLEKSKKSKSRAVVNSVVQKKSNVKQGFGFVDNRSSDSIQRKIWHNKTNTYPIQRAKYKVHDGEFDGDFENNVKTTASGDPQLSDMLESGKIPLGVKAKITFKLNDTYSKDVDELRLDQAVKAESQAENETYAITTWSNDPAEKIRNKLITNAGYFVDRKYEGITPRLEKNENDRSVWYGENSPDWWNSKGKKDGGSNIEAVLQDEPTSINGYRFEAHTVAVGREGAEEREYGTLKWGFSTKMGEDEKLAMTKEVDVQVEEAATQEYKDSVDLFHFVMRNKNSILSQENIEENFTLMNKGDFSKSDEILIAMNKYIDKFGDDDPMYLKRQLVQFAKQQQQQEQQQQQYNGNNTNVTDSDSDEFGEWN